MKKWILFAILALIQVTTSLNILAIFPYQGKSHFLVYRVLLRELANRGHNLTVISHFPEKDPPENYYDISLAGTMEIVAEVVPMETTYKSMFQVMNFVWSSGNKNCEIMLANDEVQNLWKEKRKFDVVLLEQFNSDCALGVAYKLGAPVVATCSSVFFPFQYDRFGIAFNPSYVPFHFGLGGTKPTLYQRLEAYILDSVFKAWYFLILQPNDQRSLAKYFNDIPPLEELAREIKFSLQYQHFVLTGSRLYPANVVEVGGYHLAGEKPKPLVGDLKKFVDEAEHGVVYISFGSVVKTSSMDPKKVQILLEAINEFPQRFIWKWEDKSLNVDKNKVYISSWLPQVDILAHPKTLGFYSHCGMGSVTEGLYFGVPILGMPIMGEQPSNAAAVAESGLGVVLLYPDLTKENLVQALKKILDPNFRAHAKEVSSAWQDRPTSAMDTAIFWTEFAARHPSLSFRTRAADVPFYQYYCLDIYAVLGLVIFFVVFVIRKMCCKSKNVGNKVKLN